MTWRLALLFTCFVLAASPVLAGTYYVDAVKGNDGSGDGSVGRPWRTVTHAMSKVAGPGDLLKIAAGTYDAALGEAAEIAVKSGVTMIGAGRWTTILRARLVFTNLAKAPSVQNLLFSTMTVNVTGMASKLDISTCVIDMDYSRSFITLKDGALFEPRFFNTRIQGRDIKLMAITLTNASRMGGLMMHCSTYLGIDGAHEFDVSLSSGSTLETTFVGNLFHQKRREGLCFWIGFDVYKPKNVFASRFVNNTFTMNAFHLMQEIDYRPLFLNNIFSKESGFWLLTADQCFNNCITDGTFAGINGNFAKAPRFVHEEADFRLRADSPCIDRGLNDAPGLAAYDRTSVPRFLDGDLDTAAVVDLGAQEFSFTELSVSGTPVRGGTLTYECSGSAPFGALLFVGLDPGVIDLHRFGSLLFEPSSRPMFMGWLPADLAVTVPNDPSLAGATLYAQALALLPCVCTGTLSNRVDVVIQ